MDKKNILLVLFSIIGIVLILKTINNRTIEKSQVKDFHIEDTSSIVKIFLSDRKGNNIVLEKSNNKWYANNKYKVRKDAIQTLLYTIRNIRIQQPLPNSYYETVIKNMSTSGVKVEIYTNNKKPKISYTIGGTTPSQLGNYMILNNEKEIFTVELPGFNGYLSPRYGIQANSIDINSWRSTEIFDIKPKHINNIRLNNIKIPNNSFTIKKDSLSNYNLFNQKNKQVYSNPLKLIKYLNSFRYINCEAFRDEEKNFDKKNIIYELSIQHNSKFDTLRIYEIIKNKKIEKEENYNVKRLHAKLNSGDLMLIQEYVFNKLLININELQN